MFELNNYTTKDFMVKCQTGVLASSIDGKLIPTDKYGLPIDKTDERYAKLRKKIHAVNKKTLETYYTRIYSARPGCIEMNVLSADHLCRKGLNWHVCYTATLYYDSFRLEEKGYKTLEYWLGRNLSDDLLIPKAGVEEPKGAKLGEIVGIHDFLIYYGENVTVKDIFKAYEAGEFYGKTGFVDVNMKKLQFGVEIEFTGMTRQTAAKYVAKFFDTTYTRPTFTSYDRYNIMDNKGRVWSIKSDSSISKPVDHYKEPAGELHKCELETPILNYEDIETLQELIRGLRNDRYMEVNSSCGLHIHIGGKFNAVALKNVYNLISSHQQLLSKALRVKKNRLQGYCKYVSGNAFRGYSNKDIDMATIRGRWDDCEYSRYKFVNFESFFNNKGVEFRCFNSTTHAGKIKSYIQLSLAICNYAMTASNVHPAEKKLNHDLTRMRNWLQVLGLKGDEFKSCRYHLTRYLKDDKKENASSNRAA